MRSAIGIHSLIIIIIVVIRSGVSVGRRAPDKQARNFIEIIIDDADIM